MKLEYETYVKIAEARECGVSKCRNLSTVVQDRATAIRRHKRTYDLQERSLAGTAGSDNSCDTPRLDVDIDTLQDFEVSESLTYVPCSNQIRCFELSQVRNPQSATAAAIAVGTAGTVAAAAATTAATMRRLEFFLSRHTDFCNLANIVHAVFGKRMIEVENH